jgi:hypothetical protein
VKRYSPALHEDSRRISCSFFQYAFFHHAFLHNAFFTMLFGADFALIMHLFAPNRTDCLRAALHGSAFDREGIAQRLILSSAGNRYV